MLNAGLLGLLWIIAGGERDRDGGRERLGVAGVAVAAAEERVLPGGAGNTLVAFGLARATRAARYGF